MVAYEIVQKETKIERNAEDRTPRIYHFPKETRAGEEALGRAASSKDPSLET